MESDKRNIEVLDAKMVEVFKSKTPQQRLVIAFNMWNSARNQVINYLRGSYPGWDEKKIQQEAVRRLSHGAV